MILCLKIGNRFSQSKDFQIMDTAESSQSSFCLFYGLSTVEREFNAVDVFIIESQLELSCETLRMENVLECVENVCIALLSPKI